MTVSRLREGQENLSPEILVPLLMGCALLWWIGRAMTWTMRLVVTTVTLLVVAAVIFFERGKF